jgi:hypothetical protein
MNKDIFTTIFDTFEPVFEAIRETELLKKYLEETPIPYKYVILKEKRIDFENYPDFNFRCYDVRFVMAVNDYKEGEIHLEKLKSSFLPKNIKYRIVPMEINDEFLSAKQYVNKLISNNNEVSGEIEKIINYLIKGIKK